MLTIFGARTVAASLVAMCAMSGGAAAAAPAEDERVIESKAAAPRTEKPIAEEGRAVDELPVLTTTRLRPGQTPQENLLLTAATITNPPTYLGNDRYRCVYRSANWWSYEWEGADASWSKATSGYNHFGAQDLRNTGWVGGTSKASYRAEVGEGRILNGDGWLRLQVKYPWSYSGDVDLLSEFSAVPIGGGFSSSSIDMAFYVDLLRDDSSARVDVDSFSVTADRGVPGDFDDVSNSGTKYRTVSLTGFGEVIHSAFGVDAQLSTTTQSLTNARAAFDFTNSDGHGWKTGSTQEWVYTLKPGWVLNDCGADDA